MRVAKKPVRASIPFSVASVLNNPGGITWKENLRIILTTINLSVEECNKSFDEFKADWNYFFWSNSPDINEETERRELVIHPALKFFNSYFIVRDENSVFNTFIIPTVERWIQEGKIVRSGAYGSTMEMDLAHEIKEYKSHLKLTDRNKHDIEFRHYNQSLLPYLKRFAISKLENMGYDLDEFPMICTGVYIDDDGESTFFRPYLQINSPANGKPSPATYFPEYRVYEKGNGCKGEC